MPLDTRSDKRHPMESAVTFSIHESMSSSVKINIPMTQIKAGLYDISANGCGLDSPYLIPPDTLLKIDINAAPFAQELKVERPQSISVTGTVRSCVMKAVGRYRLGVQFVEIKKEDTEFIGNYILVKDHRQSPRWDVSK